MRAMNTAVSDAVLRLIQPRMARLTASWLSSNATELPLAPWRAVFTRQGGERTGCSGRSRRVHATSTSTEKSHAGLGEEANGDGRAMQPYGERDGLIDAALRLLRLHLGLDVAFVSQFTAGSRVFSHVDADQPGFIEVGDADPLEESYCHYVVAGQLPQYLPDPGVHPIAAGMAVTSTMPVGTHFSVPLILSDGSVYGTFCGFSRVVLDELSERDLATVRMLAGMVATHVEQGEFHRRRQAQRCSEFQALQPARDLVMLGQPIVEVATGRVVAYELLARFPTMGLGPGEVFAEAWELGIGADLELRAIELACDMARQIPPGIRLTLNASPAVIEDERFVRLLEASVPERLVVEITEHTRVSNYPSLRSAIEHVKSLGARIAVDDVGTGFSGLEQILRLSPDMLKLDGVLVRDIDQLADKQAMVAALVAFAGQVGVSVVAEQVETAAELDVLRGLGVTHAQGYHLGRPAPLPSSQLRAQTLLG